MFKKAFLFFILLLINTAVCSQKNIINPIILKDNSKKRVCLSMVKKLLFGNIIIAMER
jgi:hypothetical protein